MKATKLRDLIDAAIAKHGDIDVSIESCFGEYKPNAVSWVFVASNGYEGGRMDLVLQNDEPADRDVVPVDILDKPSA